MCGTVIEAIAGDCPACGESLKTTAHGFDGESAESASVQELRVFVGRRADYYLGKWREALAGTGTGTGFNLAAFFLSGIWLPYRKMYAIAFLLYGALIVESIAEELVFVGLLGHLEVPAGIDRLGSFVAAAVCGAYGNRWYLSRARREIARLRDEGRHQDEHLQILSRRGGTSLAGAIGVFTLFIAAMIAGVIVLSIITGDG